MGVVAGQLLKFDITTRNPVNLTAETPDPISAVFVVNGVDKTALTVIEKSAGVVTLQGNVPADTLKGSIVQVRASGTIDDVDDNWIVYQALCTGELDAATPFNETLDCRRGDTLYIGLTDLGVITGADEIWFTIKGALTDSDDLAIVQITKTDGLVRFKGEEELTAAKGSVVESTSSSVAIYLDEERTKMLPDRDTFFYDLQTLISGDIKTRKSGKFKVKADVTRAIT